MIFIPILILFIINLYSESSITDLNEIKSGKTLIINKADFFYQKSVSLKIPNSNEELELDCYLSIKSQACWMRFVRNGNNIYTHIVFRYG